MASASPIVGLDHWVLFRAACACRAPYSPMVASSTNGSSVASIPSCVMVIRLAVDGPLRRSWMSVRLAVKCSGTYMAVSFQEMMVMVRDSGVAEMR